MKKGSSDQPTVMENSHTAISLNLVWPAEAQLRDKSAGLRVQLGKVGIACVDGGHGLYGASRRVGVEQLVAR